MIIVNARPAGLALAAELFRLGRKPRTIDRQATGANTSRAAVVHVRTLEVLEPLGIVPALLFEGIKAPVFRIRDRERVLAEIRLLSPEKIVAAFTHTALYAGWPTAMTALQIARKVFDERKI